jgi:hypothetical protein
MNCPVRFESILLPFGSEQRVEIRLSDVPRDLDLGALCILANLRADSHERRT